MVHLEARQSFNGATATGYTGNFTFGTPETYQVKVTGVTNHPNLMGNALEAIISN